MDSFDYTAVALAEKIKKKEVSVKEALEAVFIKIETGESGVNSYITVDKQKAMKRAEEVQKAIDAGEMVSPLAGVPMAVKDNLCTKGMATTCASKILEGFVPAYSAHAVTLLEKAGAVMIGKTNMDEFAMGSTSETSYFGAVKNPWDLMRVPGGSSGGSAAAVAAGECYYALGSDTGGSIRQPAGYCGVVGIKPTYGSVSRYGLVAYGSSLDQIGPIGRDVTDCAAVLSTITGYDPKDATSIRREDTDFMKSLSADVRGMKIGIPRQYFGEGLNPEVDKAVRAAAAVLQGLGATVEEFDLSLTDYAIPAYYTIASAEASSNLERFDGIKYGYRAEGYEDLHHMYKKTRSEGFGEEVKRRIMLGSFVLSSGYYDAYYLKALRIKALIKQEFDKAFGKYDVILGPVAPQTAPKLGESLKDPLKMYLGDIYTISANLTGICGISLPCGTDSHGLPIGLQLLGDCFMEKKIIRAAFAYEQARGKLALPGVKNCKSEKSEKEEERSREEANG